MAQIVGDFTEFVKQIIIDENISQGPQGDIGPEGPQGDQGPVGVQGNTGDKGDSVTVTDIQSNPDYSITLTFSDGTVFTSDPVRGAKGEQGDTGLQGVTGPQGNNGVDGDNLTVTSVTNNNDNTITIVFSDGTSHNTGVIKGDRGDQGEDGPRGIQGVQGVQGVEGQKGEKGDQGQGVHHVTAVGTTDPEGDFQTPGETDTYVMYGDADETINLGGFEVRNGDDAYSYVTKYGYTGTAQEFGEALTSFATLVNAGVVSSFNGRDGNVALTNSDITDAVGVDLSDVEAGATADQTASEIEALYESIIGTEKYTTVDKAKVGHIAVTQHVDLDLLEISAASNNAHTLRIDNPHSVTKAQVGLDQVDNTSDINKPVSNATQTALNGKADNAITLAGYGITDADTSSEVDAKIAGLVGAAPSTLDTLNELANALGDDPNFATTIAAQIGTKQNTLVNQTNIKSVNGDTLLGSGDLTIAAGSGGYAAALYFSDVVSTVEGSYKTLSYAPDVLETTVVAVVIGGGGEQLMETYLFSLPIGTTVIDAGKWTANFYGSVDNDNGDTRLRYEGFMKEDGTGVETTLFTSTSPELTTTVGHIEFEVTEPVKVVSATARYGIRVYASTTSNSNKTVSYIVGNGNASNTNTPLATRHDQLRARDAVNQHPISAITGLSNSSADSDTLRVNLIADLPNATSDHKLQVGGIPMHGLIWKDLIAEFIPARGGAINEPAWADIGNGIVMSAWAAGEELPVAYHVNHDYALGTDAYPHIHFMCADSQGAGAQVTWRFSYVIARGHSQGDSLTAATTDIDMTYTYTGSEVPGEHIVLECNNAQAFDLLEPDTVVLAQVILLSENVTGVIYGIQADLHYQADVEGTISKSPDFTVA